MLLRPVGLALALALSLGAAPDRMTAFPRLMLWAWERPEDFRSLDPRRAGVAFLAQTLAVRDGRVLRRPRMQPLRLPPGTALMAVTRVEVAPGSALDARIRAELAERILAQARPGVRGVQVDFDARRSERPFYRDLLADLRRRLDPALPLSMTALASWGVADGWIRDLPVDEAVPMCFAMGADAGLLRARLAQHRDFPVPVARRALGVCLQEELPWLPGGGRRIYIFSRQAWSGALLAPALERYAP